MFLAASPNVDSPAMTLPSPCSGPACAASDLAPASSTLLGAFDLGRRADVVDGRIDRATAARFTAPPDPTPADPRVVLDGLSVLDEEASEPAWQNQFSDGYRFFFCKGSN